MEGREKCTTEEIIGKILTINDFAFKNNGEGVYAIYTVKEYEKLFFFGSSAMTEALLALEEYKEEVQKEGLPFKIVCKTTSKGWPFYSVEFYPTEV